MPNGTQRLDVRLSILADDGSYIFVQYGGRIVKPQLFASKSSPLEKTRNEGAYFFTNPVFETESSKYAWLNDIVCIGRNVPMPNDPCIKYEIFAVS
jgi:hypothetical protein